jgi:hypothetical protein
VINAGLLKLKIGMSMVSDGRMPRPKRVDGRVIWDRLRIEAAFTDLPEEKKVNPLDRMLEAGSH